MPVKTESKLGAMMERKSMNAYRLERATGCSGKSIRTARDGLAGRMINVDFWEKLCGALDCKIGDVLVIKSVK